MESARFILSRLLKGSLVLIAIAILNFFLIRAAPGDPASVLAGEAGAADPIYLEQLRIQFGLHRPILEQLWIYLGQLLTLDFGFSVRYNRPVFDMIAERLPATLLLTGTAFVLSLIMGVVLGVMAAMRVGKLSDTLITVLALVFYATPLFWIALMAQVIFALKLGWLPNLGIVTVGADYSGAAAWLDVASHLVLPGLTLALFYMALYARIMRASTLEVSGADYVKTARAKGLKEGYITRKHIARNAILPVVTLAGLQGGQIVGGAVLIETIFAWPGIGRLMLDALTQRDYQVLLGVFFCSSALVVLFNILTDIVYRIVDPRIETRATA